MCKFKMNNEKSGYTFLLKMRVYMKFFYFYVSRSQVIFIFSSFALREGSAHGYFCEIHIEKNIVEKLGMKKP